MGGAEISAATKHARTQDRVGILHRAGSPDRQLAPDADAAEVTAFGCGRL